MSAKLFGGVFGRSGVAGEAALTANRGDIPAYRSLNCREEPSNFLRREEEEVRQCRNLVGMERSCAKIIWSSSSRFWIVSGALRSRN